MARVDARPSIRIRALDLLAQFGPAPSDDLLLTLASDQDAAVRCPGGRVARPTVVGDDS